MTSFTNDLTKQYEQELLSQETNSNRHILKGFLWFFLAVAFIWVLTISGFFEVDKKLVSIAFGITLVLLFPLLIILHKVDLSKSYLKYFFLSLICIVCNIIISILSFHAVLIYVIPLLYAIQYRTSKTIWFTYAINTVAMLLSSFGSFYYGICDLNLLLQSQHVRDWYIGKIVEDTLTLPINDNLAFIIIVFEVFPRSIILFVFSIMMHYTVTSGNRDALRISHLTYLKETDMRTGVYNKNKYTEMAIEYYPQIENLAVIFWDLNNLKEINDQYGHATGDRVIKAFCDTLKSNMLPTSKLYRVGGDEFLMIIENPATDEPETLIVNILNQLKNASPKKNITISSAVGLAYGTGENIYKVVETADTRMYENKKNCKERARK